jgi:hypothetical protein
MSEIQSREYFAIVPEWIVLADISSNAIRLYALLIASLTAKDEPGRRVRLSLTL